MNTSVDVLAVMQEMEDELQLAANYSGEGCYWSRDDDDLLRRSAEARAAVAELIERIEAALRGECQYFVLGTDGIQIREVRITKTNLDSLKAAIARVKGA